MNSLAMILAPNSMVLSGRSCTMNGQFASAVAWDIASGIDPIGVTDLINWAGTSINMNQAVVWEFNTEKASLEELLRCTSREGKVDRLLLAMRLEPAGNRWRYVNQQAGDRLKLLFGPFIIRSFYASAWPGTEVMGVPGEVTAIQFNQKVQQTILQTQPDLNKWVHFSDLSLPEDLCLVRSGASWPSLVTVTHEKQAWLIAPERPNLPGISESDLHPNQFVYEDEYFCRRYSGRSSRRR